MSEILATIIVFCILIIPVAFIISFTIVYGLMGLFVITLAILFLPLWIPLHLWMLIENRR